PDRFGMTGPDRAMLYRLAVETGLRAGELCSLTRLSFNLDGDNPTVTVAAEYSKRRREDTLPLRPALASELRSFLVTKAPTALAFPTMPREHVAKMFRADLEAAGIVYRDVNGLVADFHSLRHTFISNLARGGVHPKVAQSWARHSTITLTMDRYSHTLVEEQSQALMALPDLSPASRQAIRATGAEDAQPTPKNLASCLALLGRFSETSGGADGRSAEGSDNGPSVEESLENSGKPAIFQGKESGGGGIRTRERLAASSVFKTDAIDHSATPPE